MHRRIRHERLTHRPGLLFLGSGPATFGPAAAAGSSRVAARVPLSGAIICSSVVVVIVRAEVWLVHDGKLWK